MLLGFLQNTQERSMEALHNFRRATLHPATRPSALFNRAKILASLGQHNSALHCLCQAYDSGFVCMHDLHDEEELEPLFKHQRFISLRQESMDRAQTILQQGDRHLVTTLSGWAEASTEAKLASNVHGGYAKNLRNSFFDSSMDCKAGSEKVRF